MAAKSDHDALIEVVANLAALDRLVGEWRLSDQAAQLLFAHEAQQKLEKVNEFRKALSDLTQTMIPRQEVGAIVAGIERVQDDLHRDLNTIQTHLPLLLGRSDYEIRHTQLEELIRSLGTRMDRMEATTTGQNAGLAAASRATDRNRTLMFAVIGLVMTVLTVFTFSVRGESKPTTPTVNVVVPSTTTTTTAKP